LAAIALRSSGMPSTAVYLVSPRRMAAMAASLMLSGVSKSGSPGAQPDHVAAGRLQVARLLRHGDGGPAGCGRAILRRISEILSRRRPGSGW
jgi:hypothetical protein